MGEDEAGNPFRVTVAGGTAGTVALPILEVSAQFLDITMNFIKDKVFCIQSKLPPLLEDEL